MEKPYVDRNGTEIKAGMLICFTDDPTPRLVEACGEDDLGVLASNPDYLKRHPDTDHYYYALSMYSAKDILIID